MNNLKDYRNKKNVNLNTTSTQKTNVTHVQEKENLEIPDEIKQKYFVNPPYFDFIYAEEELGFNFSDFSKNQFYDFLHSIYVTELIALRKAYISRTLGNVRFLSHKFKSPFSILGCKEIRDKCEILHKCIDRGYSNIENEYLDVLECMGQFINKLREFAEKINRTLHPEMTRQFLELNSKCNELEDIRIKLRILPNYNMEGFESKFIFN